MADKWTMEAVEKLIKEYKKYECLYNFNHENYKNRNRRIEVYEQIANELQPLMTECSPMDVRKKLNALRTQYSAEKRKIIQSKNKSGSSIEEIYYPRVYWFPWMTFLDNVFVADESEDSLMDTAQFEEHAIENIQPKRKHQATKIKRKRDEEDIISQASKTMSSVSTLFDYLGKSKKQIDEFEIFGKYVGSELRQIQKYTDDIFFINKVKRNIQKIIADAWEQVEEDTMQSTRSSSQSIPLASSSDLGTLKNDIQTNESFNALN